MKTFQDSVLDICERRNYEWGYQVDIRIRGEADLVKAVARYHKLGYDRYCKCPQATCKRRCVKPSNVDADLASCVDYIYAKRTVSHTTGELYDNYWSAGGQLTHIKCSLISVITLVRISLFYTLRVVHLLLVSEML